MGKLLWLVAIALVIYPLGVLKPGMPLTLKADEPAYYMMALSLAFDHDLEVEVADIRRLTDEFPYLPVTNVILMTDDAWRTVYFGKPYIYPLLAAPAAALFGANGMVSFNMALTALMIGLGFLYLRRWNGEVLAAGFALGFFVLSSAFVYNYWLHPEIFNMASVALTLFFAFYRFDAPDPAAIGFWGRLASAARSPALLPLWSGAALAFGVYNKPMLLAFALPAVFLFWRRWGVRRALAWVAAFAIMLGLICALSVALTGHPSAYLGVWRAGPPIRSQNEMPELPIGVEAPAEVGKSGNSWEWLLRIPDVDWALLRENAYYFLVGRHTGLFPYMPFSLVALLLFLWHARGSPERWLTLVALASIALYFLIFIAFNWHGGGGFVGNRYFVMTYPAFLFLVTRLRPAWLTGAGYAAGALFLGTILTTPFGAPVRKPTLQAHTRNPPFSVLPLEFSLRRQIPGYWGDVESGVWFWGRKDVFEPHGTEFLIHGATTVEIWMMVTEPLGDVVFQVKNPAPYQRVELSLGGDREVVEFDRATSREVVLSPQRPYTVRREENFDNLIYRLLVTTETSQILRLEYEPVEGEPPRPPKFFPAGIRLAYLGSPEELAEDVYSIEWQVPRAPERVRAGRTFELPVAVRNTSTGRWPAKGAARVQIAYHWLDESGERVVREGLRTSLPRELGPDESARLAMEVLAPARPGRYLLELDAIRERISWFSRQNPAAVERLPIEVVGPVGGEPEG
ncbi:MAG: hypothetical protein R3244_09105, partial [Thermoanaerobaculia bacterium]|nr:hypothetical protein [Thermoanaerobaculia bacterium]